jgi:hypothetical protein
MSVSVAVSVFMAPPLTALNRDYIHSVQHGDVRRFDERLLGDVAIIHARTSYTAAEGTQRFGRYTDVWARRNGKWLAVSAHVTR